LCTVGRPARRRGKTAVARLVQHIARGKAISSTLHGPTLFSARTRADERPRAHQEPAYAFLDRAAGARWARVRGELDGWFARLPAAARADLRNRFAQAAELDHAGAFWELWVHEAHRRRGFEVTVNIGTEAGERRQDFVLARGRERCWLEATVVGGGSCRRSSAGSARSTRASCAARRASDGSPSTTGSSTSTR
jgi:GNAT superfamily N-acetyltransferase